MKLARGVIALALAAGACRSEPARRAATPAPAAPMAMAAAPMLEEDKEEDEGFTKGTIEGRAECNAAISAVASPVRTMEIAMEGQASRGRALERWRAVPEPCRDARWYMLAARIQRYAPVALELGDVHLADPAASLSAAIGASDDREVLAFLAFVAAAGGAPALPADACARAQGAPTLGHAFGSMDQWGDDLAYVCGHTALAGGDAATAAAKFAAIRNKRRYPDLELRMAQAAQAQGDAKTAQALAAQAASLEEVRARSFGATEQERAAIILAAQQLMK
ncbi:MAG: hypothetical protein K8W52_02655 [Deltaproteobacteria bacterium]|nr:hypothetical protein [Deltaproteobacteria bacterium]